MRRNPRKEKGLPMNLPEMIGEIQVDAATSCTQCLIDFTNVLSDELSGKLAELGIAMALRGSTHDSEAKYVEAFTDVMSGVLTLAVYTAELHNHREVEWRETHEAFVYRTSPN